MCLGFIGILGGKGQAILVYLWSKVGIKHGQSLYPFVGGFVELLVGICSEF